jgi:hypothetical protein
MKKLFGEKHKNSDHQTGEGFCESGRSKQAENKQKRLEGNGMWPVHAECNFDRLNMV